MHANETPIDHIAPAGADLPAVIWPDGCLDTARTWLALFDRVRRDQWHEYTRKQFRSELARRTEVMTGTVPDLDDCDWETLFRRLEEASMLRIVGGLDGEA